jgi:SAM-dependent methyltransferase
MSGEHYTKRFYEEIRNGSIRSAEVMVPLVLHLLPVHSVVDVGCGDGSWLSVFRKLGVDEILGIDGEYVDRSVLQIPGDRFQVADLTRPFSLARVFDLAISLEVAEHLPAGCASAFVESLCRLAPVVLFSAAIPFQGGNHHINEQWPDKWAELFRNHGYLPVDFIRKRVWQNEAVEWWYAQNALLFAHENLLESNRALKAEFEQTSASQLCLIHPRNYLELVMPGVRRASRLLLGSVRNVARTRLRPILGRKQAPREKLSPQNSLLKNRG